MEWSTDTKTGYDDLEVYMEYGYVFVSSTGRNHVRMAAFSFNNWTTTTYGCFWLHNQWGNNACSLLYDSCW